MSDFDLTTEISWTLPLGSSDAMLGSGDLQDLVDTKITYYTEYSYEALQPRAVEAIESIGFGKISTNDYSYLGQSLQDLITTNYDYTIYDVNINTNTTIPWDNIYKGFRLFYLIKTSNTKDVGLSTLCIGFIDGVAMTQEVIFEANHCGSGEVALLDRLNDDITAILNGFDPIITSILLQYNERCED